MSNEEILSRLTQLIIDPSEVVYAITQRAVLSAIVQRLRIQALSLSPEDLRLAYVKTHKIWKVFWKRADLKWHGYQPAQMVPTIEKFLAVVDADEHVCFFG